MKLIKNHNMAFTIKNPLQKASPLQQHVEGHPFNLEQQLQKERVEETIKNAKNFKLKTNNFDLTQNVKKPSVLDKFEKFNTEMRKKINQYGLDAATGTADSRGGEAKRKAFEDYRKRLGTAKQYGTTDQFKTYSYLGPEGSREEKEGYSYRPISNMFGGEGKGKNRKYPVLSNIYQERDGARSSRMYVDQNSPEYGNFVRREIALGNPDFFNDEAANSYMGGTYNTTSGVDYPQEFYDINNFRNPFERTLGSQKRGGGFSFNPKESLTGFKTQEAEALNAREASNFATEQFAQAMQSGNYEEAQAILSAANSRLQSPSDEGGFGYTSYRDDGMYGVTGGPGVAKDNRYYLNSPGVFFGNRTKDNLQFRTDQASNLYNQDYLPTRNEEIDRAAYNKYLMEKMRQTVRDTDYSFNFDTRSGERF